MSYQWVRQATRTERSDQLSEEAQGFEAFFEFEYERLFGTMCLVTASRAESEDITQEAFVRVLPKTSTWSSRVAVLLVDEFS